MVMVVVVVVVVMMVPAIVTVVVAVAAWMLADPTRVKILWALFAQESSVNVLAESVGATPAAVSQHLAKLRLAGLVESRREGTYAYYRASDAHVRRLLAETLSHAEHVTGAASGDDPHRY